MAYFYFDSSGQRQGPFNELQQIQQLIDQGVITRTTTMEVDGHRGVAGQLPGLNFSVKPGPPKPTGPPREGKSTLWFFFGWLIDIKFRDFWLPALNRMVCTVFFILCLISGILGGALMSLSLLAMATQNPGFSNLFLALIGVPGIWVGVLLYLLLCRLFYEWCIIAVDWVFKTTKAAEIFIEMNEKNR